MKKLLAIILFFSFTFIYAQPEMSKLASLPGAFSRMGFGARGIAMGNALSSVTEGNLSAYYNPALSVFQQGNHFQAAYTSLSFDRRLNFIGFTRKFELGKNKKTGKARSTAGVSLGIINSGVTGISGRDNQGFSTGELSTSENQFLLSISKTVSDKLAIGLSMKFYYYKLYEKISSTSLGFDLGALYKVNKKLNISFVVADLNSAYKWDTSSLYSIYGRISQDDFPWLAKLGASYIFSSYKSIISVEYERSSAETNYLRAGIEYNPMQRLFFRAGIDRLNISNFDEPALFSFGFEYSHKMMGLNAGINYAFVYEPYSTGDRHVVGIILGF